MSSLWSVVFTIARREVHGYFASPVGWLVLFACGLLQGIFFSVLIYDAGNPSYFGQNTDINQVILPTFFSTTLLFFLLLIPAISMNVFTEEYKDNRLVLLLASPIPTIAIVLGKFLGIVAFISVLLLSISHCIAVLSWLGTVHWSVVVLGTITIFSASAVFAGIGMWCSAQSKSPMLSLALSVSCNMGLWMLGSIGDRYASTSERIFALLSPSYHVRSLLDGLVSTETILYFPMCIAICLIATHHSVEKIRWK